MGQVEESINETIEEKTLVKKSLDGNIGTITLDNPSKHNALGAALIGGLLVALFQRLKTDGNNFSDVRHGKFSDPVMEGLN
jgi:enoyl-CoA hydratase/carnithine racemase